MQIYTDGACHVHTGKGGFSVIVINDNNEIIEEYSESVIDTTNNRMELSAILYAFHKYGVLAAAGEQIPQLYSDSTYAINTLSSWAFTWAKKGWIKSDNKVPENLDLVQDFYNHWQAGYRIQLHKVPGHCGYKYNELADKLARNASDKFAN